MSDGTVLAADVFRPSGAGRFPTILVRTPYDNLASPALIAASGIDPQALAREGYAVVVKGYAVVVQDVRGTGGSVPTISGQTVLPDGGPLLRAT